MSFTHADFQKEALALAERGRFTVSPNPMVGCVIVKDQEVIGRGYHERAGGAHAEVIALQAAGEAARGATVYVTLEPCCHFGRTPPCTSALIEAGIREIHVACLDANPVVRGKGVEALRQAGIKVEVGLGQKEALQLNEIFFHSITTKRPFVILKWAMSLDGKTITHSLDSRKISNATSHEHTQQTRAQVDAILVGANTARDDNPLLTARHSSSVKNPLRIILSGRGDLPSNLRLFNDDGKTCVATYQTNLSIKNAEMIFCKKTTTQQIDLLDLLTQLGERGITSLLVEGGMQTHQQFFEANLVNKIQVYLAPLVIGTLPTKHHLPIKQTFNLDNDFFIETTW